MSLTLEERAAAYHNAFPNYPKMWVDGGWLMGIWIMGNNYRKPAGNYYGAYPGSFLKRALALFPDRTQTLHLFSGTLQAGENEVTVDVNAENNPSVIADVRALPFCNEFDFVLADPPYSQKDADHYGTKMVARGPVMRELRGAVKTGAMLGWLDTMCPMYANKQWRRVGAIGVSVSTNTRTRLFSLFEAA
jgi:hypothetical protein